MPDTKITALAAITTVAPANDLFAIVDVSDNSMAASGTTKNITTNQILGAGGTATLASATITGDLTVRTDKLAVRSNGVGIGTTSPTPYSGYTTLAILGGANGGVIDINTSGGTTAGGMQIASTATSTIFDVSGPSGGAAASILFRTGAYGALGERYRIDGTGQSTWSVGGSTAMTLNSTGLGVGQPPTAKLDILGDPSSAANNTTTGALTKMRDIYTRFRANSAGISGDVYAAQLFQGASSAFEIYNVTSNPLVFGTAATERMRIDSSGNVGIGVTPSAGKGCLQLSSGINFPATQVASSDANTLDDYEEGTWTPVVIGTTTNGVGTYTNQVGFYTKIGNLVTVQAYITWTAHTATGNMRLSGLPFANSPTAGSFSAVCFGFVNNLTLTAGNILTGFTSVGNTFIDCFQTPTGGGASTSVPIDTAAELIYTVTYRV